jgi:cystathionine beta-lyase
MALDFNWVIDRRGTNSEKWKRYGPDVLPLWVADMDFAAPEPILEALRAAADHGVFGYEFPSSALYETVAARMGKLYGWEISPDMVVATPGMIAGFNAAARCACSQGEGILIQPPVYPPFLSVHKNAALVRQDAPLKMVAEGNVLQYSVDFDVFEKALDSSNARTAMFLLCNPHNPTGQIYSRSDLVLMADICIKKDMIICSDEIHSELLLGDVKHTPLAAISPEIADRTITLVAPSKTFNIAGLFCAFAIIPNPDLLRRYKKTLEQMSMHVNSLGLRAAEIAFSGACDEWLAALRDYLLGNRDYAVEFVKEEINGVRITVPQATYLAWLDCNELVKSGRIKGIPHEFFLKEARVALNDGMTFGSGGEGFVRLNFGCPRKTLDEALERMRAALSN